jgi:hypothetical protein
LPKLEWKEHAQALLRVLIPERNGGALFVDPAIPRGIQLRHIVQRPGVFALTARRLIRSLVRTKFAYRERTLQTAHAYKRAERACHFSERDFVLECLIPFRQRQKLSQPVVFQLLSTPCFFGDSERRAGFAAESASELLMPPR